MGFNYDNNDAKFIGGISQVSEWTVPSLIRVSLIRAPWCLSHGGTD